MTFFRDICIFLTMSLALLRMLGVIGISWWWVLSPLWFPLALAFSLALITFVVLGIGAVVIALIDAAI